MERRFAVRYDELMAEAEVKPEVLEGVLKRLDEFVKPFAVSLKHAAQRQHAAEYVAGLVSNVRRKNIETIAYLHEQDRQPMQKFIGQKPWDEEPMIDALVRQVGASIGRADGVVVIDPSGVLKQGKLHEELQSDTLRHLCDCATRLNRRKQTAYFYHWKKHKRVPPLKKQLKT